MKFKMVIVCTGMLFLFGCATKYEVAPSEKGVAYIKGGVYDYKGKEYTTRILKVDEKYISKKDFKHGNQIRLNEGEHKVHLACSHKNIFSYNNIMRVIFIATGSIGNVFFLDDDEVYYSEVEFDATIGKTYEVFCQYGRYSWVEETGTKKLIAKSKETE